MSTATHITPQETKMKTLFLLATRFRAFLIEIPPIILLILTLRFHNEATGLLGFYPLEIFLVLLMAFILVYFFRAITVSYDEIRIHGFFSSKDRVYFKKGQTLVLTLMPRDRVRFEVLGALGDEMVYSWLKKEETQNHDISHFRESAYGGRKTVIKVLKFFGVDAACANNFDNQDGALFENDFICVTTETRNEVLLTKIKFKELLV